MHLGMHLGHALVRHPGMHPSHADGTRFGDTNARRPAMKQICPDHLGTPFANRDECWFDKAD